MRPPEFWDHVDGKESGQILRALLSPVASLYARATANRIANTKPIHVDAPVICVGNLTLGGTGKTPITRLIRAMLLERGIVAHVLLRGHGGKLKGPTRVALGRHASRHVGDEALLHARDGPTWIARDRVWGARAAIKSGAHAVLLDDGFQNPGLAKDLSILVFDAAHGVGNGRVFPAGPLREPIRAGLKRADMVVLMGAPLRATPGYLSTFKGPVLSARVEPTTPPPTGPLIGFCGIGRPQRFFDAVRAAGGDLIDGVPFSDHHVYSDGEIDGLRKLANAHRARLITTEKDFVRLPGPAQEQTATFPVRARFSDDAPLRVALDALFEKS
jgi:tetraacyldisaccharide 4'-kinase